MPCHKPLDAWRGPNGGRVFFKPSVHAHNYLQIPCGQCDGCRLEYARQWAVRCMNEASCWDFNSFVLCTYSDDKLPPNGSLVLEDHQNFIKRLRDRLDYPRMKYYMCGEYGDRHGRPHYHYLLFGIDFADKRFLQTTPSGHKLYTSALLDDIWGLGHCNIGSVTFDSACYVAKYILKKVKISKASPAYYRDAYNIWDKETGEVFASLLPEFCQASRSSGIGREFYERYMSDIFPRDSMVVNGAKVRPPRYYTDKFAIDDPLRAAWMKEVRRRKAALDADKYTPERLEAKAYRIKARRNNRGVQ